MDHTLKEKPAVRFLKDLRSWFARILYRVQLFQGRISFPVSTGCSLSILIPFSAVAAVPVAVTVSIDVPVVLDLLLVCVRSLLHPRPILRAHSSHGVGMEIIRVLHVIIVHFTAVSFLVLISIPARSPTINYSFVYSIDHLAQRDSIRLIFRQGETCVNLGRINPSILYFSCEYVLFINNYSTVQLIL